MQDNITPDSAKPKLVVRYSMTVPEEHPAIYAYALKAEVTAATIYPEHLFVFQRSPSTPAGDAVDSFIQIASPLDIEEIPVNAPNLQEGMPYYRAKEVTLWFRNIEDLKLAKEKMKADIAVLTTTYDILNGELDNQEEVTYE